METPITSAALASFFRGIKWAITALDSMIEEYRPTVFQETYLTSEEIRDLFGLSLRCLQNYRDSRIIPYTCIGGKILYPQSQLYELLKSRYVNADSK